MLTFDLFVIFGVASSFSAVRKKQRAPEGACRNSMNLLLLGAPLASGLATPPELPYSLRLHIYKHDISRGEFAMASLCFCRVQGKPEQPEPPNLCSRRFRVIDYRAGLRGEMRLLHFPPGGFALLSTRESSPQVPVIASSGSTKLPAPPLRPISRILPEHKTAPCRPSYL